MSAVDFGAFVAELATQSGQAILPFFRAKHATAVSYTHLTLPTKA